MGGTNGRVSVKINDMYSPLNFTIAGVVKDGYNQAMLYIPIKTLLVLAPGVLTKHSVLLVKCSCR